MIIMDDVAPSWMKNGDDFLSTLVLLNEQSNMVSTPIM